MRVVALIRVIDIGHIRGAKVILRQSFVPPPHLPHIRESIVRIPKNVCVEELNTWSCEQDGEAYAQNQIE
jgi:hypothetical protein